MTDDSGASPIRKSFLDTKWFGSGRAHSRPPSYPWPGRCENGKALARDRCARRTVREVAAPELTGAVVTGWRVVDYVQLLLAVRGQPEEIRLKCRCELGHWIVREHTGKDGRTLLATCHNCGNRVELLLEGARLPKA